MKLFLLSLLFSLVCTVSSLTCYQCSFLSAPCYETETTCSSLETACQSAATTSYIGRYTFNEITKNCSTPADCGEVSVHVLGSRITANIECCSTSYCNTGYAPAYTNSTPNGLKCCADEHCQITMQCLGIEDTCLFNQYVEDGLTWTMRGCASSNACGSQFSHITLLIGQITCCKGNFCNHNNVYLNSTFSHNHARLITLDILLALLPIVVLKFIS
ncbi:phospholipase A2 inhibitor and Ly6/PLAUR domain-containing protein-like [Polypterus senegalus]|uniref:phospholipase A2 inhibitor and Ly6/PLAUR domain-containing protein-like n=1 Tax=Polypterus senegalus TaxID=55291 RepID=UPI001966000E|nr:phospholipase A2 inhibitor and Ly6/PLAUR domain-containing protein-like [Polypterus senegalus]